MTSNNSSKVLPSELLGRSIRQLTIVDRLRCEWVSPRWSRTVWELGWSDVRKLDRDVVFEGATLLQRERFTVENLISLIHRVGPTLVELDLSSFGPDLLRQFIPEIAESLQQCPKLEKLNIRGFDLTDFVVFLPSTLRQLEFWGHGCNIQTLETLSRRCPNLEEVPFNHFNGINLEIVGAFIGRFPRQNKLDLSQFSFRQTKPGVLVSIGKQLKKLEELRIINHGSGGLDEQSLEAIAEGCQQLRQLHFNAQQLPEKSLFHLAKMSNLTTLVVFNGAFSDAVLKAIARRVQLKKLNVFNSPLTDDSVVYLVDRCKITERSLEAVVAEVRRRHGSPPRALPSGPDDKGIFYFWPAGTGIKLERGRELTDGNPWLAYHYDPRESI